MSPRDIPKYLGQKLNSIRSNKGYTLDEMAEALGMKAKSRRSRVFEWEKGTRQPSLRILLQYAKIAGVSTDKLIDDNQILVF